MKPLYTQKEFDNAKGIDLLPLECYCCSSIFYRYKKDIKYNMKINKSIKYCSISCHHIGLENKAEIICENCGKIFNKKIGELSKSKSKKHFCSLSCAASYNNTHKSHGNRRSKLEKWLEEQLTILYPNLEIHYNSKTAINSELDIYIPSLNLAFELNGIFHYEPIYGVDKLQKIQENDQNKFKACHEAKIDLCIIDTSGQKYIKPKSSQKYLDIIISIIKERLLTI